MPPHKILVLTNTLGTAGTERNLVAICQHLDRTRYEPEVWMLHGGGAHEPSLQAIGVPIRNLGRKRARSPLFALRAARHIARTDADLIHVFLPAIGFYAALARSVFGLRKPIVFWMGTPKTRRRHRWLFRWFVRCFDRVIANSNSVKEVCKSLGFSNEQIVVIENGHDTTRFESPIDRARIRGELGVQPSEKLILFVGRLIDTKRVCDAIDALKLLQPAQHKTKLVIVGEGAERLRWPAQVERLGLRDRVILTGRRSDIPELLRSADLFVFPSESEGLPNSIIEACLRACRSSPATYPASPTWWIMVATPYSFLPERPLNSQPRSSDSSTTRLNQSGLARRLTKWRSIAFRSPDSWSASTALTTTC